MKSIPKISTDEQTQDVNQTASVAKRWQADGLRPGSPYTFTVDGYNVDGNNIHRKVWFTENVFHTLSEGTLSL